VRSDEALDDACNLTGMYSLVWKGRLRERGPIRHDFFQSVLTRQRVVEENDSEVSIQIVVVVVWIKYGVPAESRFRTSV